MKKILGLDLGTNSIGWAVVNEAENKNEQSEIIRIGVRINPTVEEKADFEKGKPITINADRRIKRGSRHNLQRYKLRRKVLIEVLKRERWIIEETPLYENGKGTTFETRRLRAKAATEEISLSELARVLLTINKKRGYKSNRKIKNTDDGKIIDGMDVARQLQDKGCTPGELCYDLLKKEQNHLPEFYRSDLVTEFRRIWKTQQQFYPLILTDELCLSLEGKPERKNEAWGSCINLFGIEDIKPIATKLKGKESESVLVNYRWRKEALSKRLDLERLYNVLRNINNEILKASTLLGCIGDRSKTLLLTNQTIGQYQFSQLMQTPHQSLRNQTFYRKDYEDEFDQIWQTQARWHKELTPKLKHELRDIIIFYQRHMKSQKHLVAFCEFESEEKQIIKNGKERTVTFGLRACPKSSPLFQEFNVWQSINNIEVRISSKENRLLSDEEKSKLYHELCLKEKMSKKEAIALLFGPNSKKDINLKSIEGNRTMALLFRAYLKIIDLSGHCAADLEKMSAVQAMDTVKKVFNLLGFNTDILSFNALAEGKAIEHEPLYRLWHLIYSYQGDNSTTGNDKLIEKLSQSFGFDRDSASILADLAFENDFGSLSAKAIRKILPYLYEGQTYDKACASAGYRHSRNSLTTEERDQRELKPSLDLLQHNSLRNPVVEKTFNQMVNVVNAVISTYGRPDEIRIEMARELKKSQEERKRMDEEINKANKENESIRTILKEEFHLSYVSRNDIIRYKLYKELETNGYKTLYSQTYIPKEKLFSKEFDIEHIIPQAKLFDDSFSNKTLEARQVNIDKSNSTAFDFVNSTYGDDGAEQYKARVDKLYKDKIISKAKHDKLLMPESDIPSGFVDRDLRNTQYIARKAKEILEGIAKVVTPTTGSVTDTLREDWQLIDVMKELNWDKYQKLGLTEIIPDRDGHKVRRIKDWTKRNDHRHHAMDALTIAFTRPAFIQYLNNKNARSNEGGSIWGIEHTYMCRDEKGHLRFIPPMPLDIFRTEAKKHLGNILISLKSKNKVTTPNKVTIKNKKKKEEPKEVTFLTPRGQLHNDTIYGKITQYKPKDENIGASFNEEKIMTVASKRYREALLKRLDEYGGDAKKAFTGSNSLKKNPIFLNEAHTAQVPLKVKTILPVVIYTKRAKVDESLKIEKVIDRHIRTILEERVKAFGGNQAKAFANLDENPIWQNHEKGITIKHVIISAVSNALPLHDKHDHRGHVITDEDGKPIPNDFVNTSNNHHVAIYRDAEGNLQEKIVSFIEVVTRKNNGLPVIDKDFNHDQGWQFLFSMKQNEHFVFPDEEHGFIPSEIDLCDPNNRAVISPHLFRVQALSSKDYWFRHHLETTVEYNNALAGIAYKRIRSVSNLEGIIKVRINHLGFIVQVGEY